jgi:uncharacterized protein YlxP (DUF503 family)
MSAPSIGALTLEITIEESYSLKDKRNVVRSLKDRLRTKFNVSVAEIAGHGTWDRAVVAAVTVSKDREYAEQVLQAVEREAESILGGALTGSGIEWLS